MKYLKEHGEIFLLIVAVVTAALWGISQLFPVLSLPQKVILGAMLIFWIAGFSYCIFKSDFPFFRKYKAQIGLTILVVYVITLGIMTISEVFELDWFDWL
jgi:hypothetical protein